MLRRLPAAIGVLGGGEHAHASGRLTQVAFTDGVWGPDQQAALAAAFEIAGSGAGARQAAASAALQDLGAAGLQLTCQLQGG